MWYARCLNQAAECERGDFWLLGLCVCLCWGRGAGVGSVADILYILCQMEFGGRAIMLFPWSVTCLTTLTPFTQQVDRNKPAYDYGFVIHGMWIRTLVKSDVMQQYAGIIEGFTTQQKLN
jgi:hypothetical protein